MKKKKKEIWWCHTSVLYSVTHSKVLTYHELHVSCAWGFCACQGNLLRQVCSWNHCKGKLWKINYHNVIQHIKRVYFAGEANLDICIWCIRDFFSAFKWHLIYQSIFKNSTSTTSPLSMCRITCKVITHPVSSLWFKNQVSVIYGSHRIIITSKKKKKKKYSQPNHIIF